MQTKKSPHEEMTSLYQRMLTFMVAGDGFELPTNPLRYPKCANLVITRRISTAAED